MFSNGQNGHKMAPRNMENANTSNKSMKIMSLSKQAEKGSKWPIEAFINHHLGIDHPDGSAGRISGGLVFYIAKLSPNSS